jgi:hypothetical protein
MIAPDSQMVRSVFGSYMVGRRPLGLCLVYSGFLTSERGISIRSCGMRNSLRIMYTFPGFGPSGPPQKVIGLMVEAMLLLYGRCENELKNLLPEGKGSGSKPE